MEITISISTPLPAFDTAAALGREPLVVSQRSEKMAADSDGRGDDDDDDDDDDHDDDDHDHDDDDYGP